MRRSFICFAFLFAFAGLLAAQAPIDVPQPAPPSSNKKLIKVKVSEAVANAFVIRRVPPKYPDEARQARIQGTVVVEVVVDIDGNVKDVRLISGHPLLAPAAIDAVRQWKFKPYLLNREPVELDSLLTVPFSLKDADGNATNDSSAPAPPETSDATGVLGDTPSGPPESPAHPRVRVSLGVSAGLLIHKVDPEFPPGTEGAEQPVFLKVKIDKDGRVESAEFSKGDQRLAEAAIAAVKQWRYKPYLLNGAPIEIETMVAVDFKKSKKQVAAL